MRPELLLLCLVFNVAGSPPQPGILSTETVTRASTCKSASCPADFPGRHRA